MGGDGEYRVGLEGEKSRVLSGVFGWRGEGKGCRSKMAVEKGNAEVPTQQ